MESPLDKTCTNEDKKLRRIKIEKMKKGRGERETWNGREVRRITKREMDERIEEVGN